MRADGGDCPLPGQGKSSCVVIYLSARVECASRVGKTARAVRYKGEFVVVEYAWDWCRGQGPGERAGNTVAVGPCKYVAADIGQVADIEDELDPKDSGSRVLRASVDLDWRADPKPLHEICEAFMNENPAGTAEWGQSWIELALCERDRALAERALATMPGGFVMNGLHIPRTLMEGCAGRAFRMTRQREKLSPPRVPKSSVRCATSPTMGHRSVCSV